MRRLRRAPTALAALLAVAGCAAPVKPPEPPAPAAPAASTRAEPPRPPAPAGARVELAALPGWPQDDHAAALAAFVAGCSATAAPPALAPACAQARALGRADRASARAFLERTLVAERVGADGLLTGYYAPAYPARTAPDAEFSAPVRPKPADLISLDLAAFDPTLAGKRIVGRVMEGTFQPYPTRALIERRATAAGEVLAWMRPEELFFLQIQGSGVLTFPDGGRRRAVYAAHNGRPFVGLARPLRERGLLADHQTSAANIQAWLAARRGPEADALMDENPRYVFFALEPDDGREPAGAAAVSLPAGRAVAVDPSIHAYGQPLWIDADAGALAGAFPTYRRLVAALDTGGAIKGPVRADLYIGSGQAAGVEAGRIRHRLTMYRLVPR
jgi:membrane-bound lytic murein transglycosylase A